MSKPRIAITVESKHDPEDARTRGKLELNWNYAQAVVDAGGTPIIVPPMADMKEIAEWVDGWLIPGGLDIDAKHFGEENHPKVELQDPSRYDGESALYRELDPEVPILGICYGCQFLNVVRGGTLIQHLPDEVESDSHSGGTLQAYQVDAESKLADVTGATEIQGKSYHHQAIREAAPTLKVVAKTDDGVVEAVEATDRPWVIGVQWHPERTTEDSASQRLFADFIAAAAAYAAKKRS